MSIPYTYFIKHKETGEFYYGVKFGKDADPSTFWVNYFTSSKVIKTIIERDGINCFDVKIRKIFDDPEKAYNWEQKVLNKIIKNEKCLNNAVGFTWDSNKNRHIKDKNGLNNYEKCAKKARLTMLNDIDENGYNTYQRVAYKVYNERDEDYKKLKSQKSAQTMIDKGIYDKISEKHSKYQNEIMPSGLTRAKETGLKVSQTRKIMFQNGTIEKQIGEKNPAAKIINIFNENDELIFKCHGNFQKICKENCLPTSFLKKSYQNNGLKFPSEYRRGMSKLFYEENKQFAGWYALEGNIYED